MTVRRMSQGEMMVWAAEFVAELDGVDLDPRIEAALAVCKLRKEPLSAAHVELFTKQMRDP